MKFVVAVPARLESTRLPRKVLADIGGVPMLQRVLIEAGKARTVSQVVLCTDSAEVAKHAGSWGVRVIMTSPDCASGSERIASVLDQIDADVVINVQGDQPFVDPLVIEQMCEVFRERRPTPEVVTPVYRLPAERLGNPDAVKVVVSTTNKAMYFSRSAVPFVRGRDISEWTELGVHFGHVGIYGFRRDVLARWLGLSATTLEDAEKLEQLRLLSHGITIDVYEIVHQPRTTLSVDSPADLETARRMVKQ